jgi:alpha-L-fucosidase
MKLHALVLTIILAAGFSFAEETAAPVSPAALTRWQDARFGMFIHWGPVSLKGTEIGWSRGAQIPIAEYDTLYQKFNPTQFNADAWVAVAKAAGMKYLVLTTKHHDGFCLWNTRQTDYHIMKSPFGRDVVKELAAACKKGGIGFGTYYSTTDWHHPDFPLTSPGGNVVREKSNLDAYTEYLKAQTKELLTQYGPLFTLWYDVPQRFDAARGQSVINMARAIQPDIVINNRTGARGDYDTPEQSIGGFQLDRPWETCMTLCNQWAWKPNDPMKSLEQCLHTLIRTNGGNGNLLFNVGPMPTGEIEARQVERLKEMGAWLSTRGESLYGTRGGPWKPTPDLTSTRKGSAIYLHLLRRSEGPVKLKALPVTIRSAKILNGPEIKTTSSEGILTLEIPNNSWDPVDTIVVFTVAGSAMDLAPLSATPAGPPGLITPNMKASASVIYQNDPNYAASRAIDGDPETRWATPDGTREASLQIDLLKSQTLARIEIDEAYAESASRVRKFELQKKTGDAWVTFHTGTTLGAHFQASFTPVSTREIRLRILDASNGPTLSEVRLFAQGKKP